MAADTNAIKTTLTRGERDFLAAACRRIYLTKNVPAWALPSDRAFKRGGQYKCAKCYRMFDVPEDGDDPAEYCGTSMVLVGEDDEVNVCDLCVIAALCKCRKSKESDSHTCSNCHGALVAPYNHRCSCDHPVTKLRYYYTDDPHKCGEGHYEPNLEDCSHGCCKRRLRCETCLRFVNNIDVCECSVQIAPFEDKLGGRECSCCGEHRSICPHCFGCMHNTIKDN